MSVLWLTALLACVTDDDVLPLYDQDHDGFYDPGGADAGATAPFDCDDGNDAVHPGATETCNGLDDDCDGQTDVGAVDAETAFADVDGDGYGSDEQVTGCDLSEGTSQTSDDCNDGNADVHPGGTELPYDGIDQDCDGGDLVDLDGDGADSKDAGGDDCDDDDEAIHPGAAETWYDYGVDNDCDGNLYGDVTLSTNDVPTRLDAPNGGEQAGYRLGWWEAGECLFVSAPYASDGAGLVYAEIAGASGARTMGDNGVVTLSDPYGYLSSSIAVSDDGGLVLSSQSWSSHTGDVFLLDAGAVCGGDVVDARDAAQLDIQGPAAEAYFGSSVVWLGDVDGDGLDDLAVASPGEDAGGTFRGAVYVFSDPPRDGSVLAASDADLVAWGSEDYGFMGSVVAVQDSAGPGTPYLVFSQSVATAGALGVLRVDPASLSSTPSSVLDVADGGVATWSTGKTMTTLDVGDMGHDGADDLLTGAWTLGFRSIRDLDGVIVDTDAPVTLSFPVDAYYTGAAAIGDVDGDDAGDLLLLSEDWPSGDEQGKAAIFRAADLPPSGVVDVGALPLHVEGITPGFAFGYTAVPTSDFDGDGFEDVAVAANAASYGGTSSGSIYLVPMPFR